MTSVSLGTLTLFCPSILENLEVTGTVKVTPSSKWLTWWRSYAVSKRGSVEHLELVGAQIGCIRLAPEESQMAGGRFCFDSVVVSQEKMQM